ncbi:WG repeat-containing protein [Xanthomonas theicola]|uniref:WG repeat-containing protein n=1 Tax=Xanthomonas theicola TaxID=56464 RepID=UPI0016398AC0|nr:WG repeat-containing protein [Xanthomonas theicola]
MRTDGGSLPVIVRDKGPDAFAQSLTRGIFNGRIGFYDRQLREMVAPVHDFAWPFADGIAQVCDGCRPGPPDGDARTPLQGGRWYSIDHSNRAVPPPSRGTCGRAARATPPTEEAAAAYPKPDASPTAGLALQ